MSQIPIKDWPIIPEYVCRQCGDVARHNPETNREWGCATCNGSSFTIYFNFVRCGERLPADREAAP